MAKTDFKSTDDYLATLPEEDREVIRKIRAAILEAVPEAEEVISYQLPAFKFHGWIFYLSTATKHFALSCPPPFTVYKHFAAELEPYEVATSALRFPRSKPVPYELISRMAKFRADENLAREKVKKA